LLCSSAITKPALRQLNMNNRITFGILTDAEVLLLLL
jgi:hypothetical protein